MKAIKIIPANVDAMTAALLEANGKSSAHTQTSGSFMLDIAATFEAKLLALVGSKKMASGAQATWVSGLTLPNAYKFKRTVTHLVLERRSADWWLVEARAKEGYKDAGPEYLTLTAEQDAAVHAIVRRQYRLAPSASATTTPV